MKVAIHQPNFLPWRPFFEKMEQADMFVLLNHCDFSRRVYQHRFSLRGKWHIMPVCSNHGTKVIEKRYLNPYYHWEKITKSINRTLRGAGSVMEELGARITDGLATTNMGLIYALRDMLGIQTALLVDWPMDITGSARLAEICAAVGADTYLSGPSGRKYITQEDFDSRGVRVEYFEAKDKRHTLEVLCG